MIMRQYIKGVGSGLPVVRELLSFSGGTIEIEDNLSRGTVVTIKLDNKKSGSPTTPLSKRQVSILSLITELGSAGPSVICREIKLGLSTVHRELIFLEDVGLIESLSQGKRGPTPKGLEVLNKTISGGVF